MKDEYVTIAEAAKELQRSTSTVWRYIKEQHIATFKRPLTKRVYVRRSDIKAIPLAYRPRQHQGGA